MLQITMLPGLVVCQGQCSWTYYA